MLYVRSLTIIFIIIMLAVPGLAGAAQGKAGAAAVVNGKEIGVDDYNRELNRVQRLVLGTGKPLTCQQVARLKTEVIEGMVQRELLWQESRRNVKVTDVEINEELKKLKDQYASEADFQRALTATKVTPDALRSQVERTIAVRKTIEAQFTSAETVSDKEARSYYDRNRGSLRRPEQVRANHILIKVDPVWDSAKKVEARKRADDIVKKARQGQDFESLARTHSEDKTNAAKGGDLGWVGRGTVVKPFEEALFALKPGKVSDVVETHLGYHIIKAGERRPAGDLSYEEVKDRITSVLREEKKQQRAKTYIDGLRKKASVQITLPADE